MDRICFLSFETCFLYSSSRVRSLIADEDRRFFIPVGRVSIDSGSIIGLDPAYGRVSKPSGVSETVGTG